MLWNLEVHYLSELCQLYTEEEMLGSVRCTYTPGESLASRYSQRYPDPVGYFGFNPFTRREYPMLRLEFTVLYLDGMRKGQQDTHIFSMQVHKGQLHSVREWVKGNPVVKIGNISAQVLSLDHIRRA